MRIFNILIYFIALLFVYFFAKINSLKKVGTKSLFSINCLCVLLTHEKRNSHSIVKLKKRNAWYITVEYRSGKL